MPLSNAKIWVAIRKIVEEEYISNDNNVTEDKFSHVSNTQIDHAENIFTSDKLDKLYDNLRIEEAKYYE